AWGWPGFGEPTIGVPAWRREGTCCRASYERFVSSYGTDGRERARKGAGRPRKAGGKAGAARGRSAEPSPVAPSPKLASSRGACKAPGRVAWFRATNTRQTADVNKFHVCQLASVEIENDSRTAPPARRREPLA